MTSQAADAPALTPAVGDDPGEPPAAGLYVHVPFCRHRCGYCDFAVTTAHDPEQRAAYVDAVRRRLADLAAGGLAAMADTPGFGSVFVGGGTPSRLTGEQLAALLDAVRAAVPVAGDAEVSVEANPEDVDASLAQALAGAGVTRVSLGVQSFDGDVLALLDRRHDPEDVPGAVAALRGAGIEQVNVDLIYGTPGETEASWRHTMAAALGLQPDHVSGYALTLSPGTPYWRAVTLGQQPAPDDDVAAERMDALAQQLAAAGYERYEVSNWARPGARCRHNLATWRGGDYLGVGPGAHSHWQGRRWWEWRAAPTWTARVTAGGDPVGGAQVLSAAERRTERLAAGLRLVEGVARHAVEPIDERAAKRLVAAGVLADDGQRLRVPPACLAVADGVAAELLL
jgi:oxygen-independent coproporphyrinogen-3 oxidase